MINGLKNFVQRAKTIVLGHPSNAEKMVVESMGGGWGYLARNIGVVGAMAIPTVYACVGIRAQSVAMTPLKLYKKTAVGKKPATDHPAYKLTSLMFNPAITSFMAREYMQTCLDLKGNAYAQIIWGPDGFPAALQPIDPNRVRIDIKGGVKSFRVIMNDGSERTFFKEEILHVSNVSLDGVYGASVLALHRETFNRAIQQSQYSTNFYENSARPSGAFTAPGELSQDAYDRLKEQLKKEWQGTVNAGKPMLLEGDLKFLPIAMNAEDMQYIEQMKFSQLDICQIFQTPPHMVGILDRATFSNIEEQNIDFYRRTLMALFIRWEMELNTTLLVPKEWSKLFFKFDVRAFLRGNMKARYDVYAIARNWGIMSLNEIRELEDMDLLDPEIGDVHLEPLNMKKAGEDDPNQAGGPDQKDGQPAKDPKGPNTANTKKEKAPPKKRDVETDELRAAFEEIFEDLISRSVSKHCLNLRKKLPKVESADQWRATYTAFFLEERRNVLDSLSRSIGGYCRLKGIEDVDQVRKLRDEFVTGFLTRAVEDLDGVEYDPARVELQLDRWLTARAANETKELISVFQKGAA